MLIKILNKVLLYYSINELKKSWKMPWLGKLLHKKNVMTTFEALQGMQNEK